MQIITGIYKIINKINNKYYVGSSDKIQRRWIHHKRDLKNNKHSNSHLQYAWNKYGEFNFEFVIIQECPKEILFKTEQTYLDECKKNPKSNYNTTYIAGGGNITQGTIRISKDGIIKSIYPYDINDYILNGWALGNGKMKEETKIKIGDANRGKKKPPFSMEHRKKLGNANRGRKYIMSEECKQKIRLALIGRKHTTKSIMKMGLKGEKHPFYGKHHTKETCKKLSVALKGQFLGEKNPRFDITIYSFQNIKTKEIILSTRYDFYKKYNMNPSNVNKLLKRKINSINGWKIYHPFP